MTKSRFDIEYNKWLQRIDVKEYDSVWNEIEDELDYIETWDNISANLDEIMPQKNRVVPLKYLKVLVAAAAIILIMFLPVRYFVEKANPPAIISESINETDEKEEIKSEEPILSTTTDEEVELVQSTETGIHLSDNSYILSSGTVSGNEMTPITESKVSEGKSFSDDRLILPIRNAIFNSDILLNSRDVIITKSKETELSILSEPIGSSGLSIRVEEVGLVFGYKNTWLLNHETLNGLNPKKLGNSLPTFHEDIGVTSSFELNNRHMFGLEFLWKSGTGQNYKQYINASFVDRSINLDYLKLQAFYFLESNRLPGQVIVGGYFARLTMAEEQKAKTRFSVDDSYSDFDYGILAGYEFKFALKNNIIFKPGIRVSYDLVNIFEGDDTTPSHFKRTRNLAASFNISLSYRFLK